MKNIFIIGFIIATSIFATASEKCLDIKGLVSDEASLVTAFSQLQLKTNHRLDICASSYVYKFCSGELYDNEGIEHWKKFHLDKVNSIMSKVIAEYPYPYVNTEINTKICIATKEN